MKQLRNAVRRSPFGIVAAFFLLTAVAVVIPTGQASAAGLLYRSLKLSSSQPSGQDLLGAGEVPAEPGDAANGDEVSHTYIFQVRTTSPIEALSFSYCNDAFGYVDVANDCTVPAGFTAVGAPSAVVEIATNTANVATQGVESIVWGGTQVTYTVAAGVTNKYLVVENATGISPTAGNFVRVTFTATPTASFVNPTSNETFFAHITTHSDMADVSGSDIDEGTVTSSTANTVSINTRVEEHLDFSVGGHGGATGDAGGDPDVDDGSCQAITTSGTGSEGRLTMGDSNQALSTQSSANTKSYFRIATNSARGARVFYAGQTLTSTAGDEIAALDTAPTAADNGTEQFGLAVLPTGTVSTATYTELVPEDNYDGTGPTAYFFDPDSNGDPVLLAQSDGVVACDTVAVEYLADISNETPAGLYSTKISYVAAPSY